MANPRELNIDVIDLPAEPLAAWFRKVAADLEPEDLGARGRTWPGQSQLAGRWLGLESSQNDRFVGAAAARIYPDASADLVLPDISAQAEPSLVAALLERLATQLASRHVRLVTAYLPVEATGLHQSMADAGFQRTHDLLILASTVGPRAAEDPAGLWTFHACQPTGQPALQAVFARSLIGSLDFPDLHLAASADASLARFTEAGIGETRMWYWVEYRGRPAGCLLMAVDSDRRLCELLYWGLLLEYRGVGGGLVLVKYALRAAAKLDLQMVIAGVDAENDPAIAVYAAAGFDPVARRGVFFRRLTTGDAVSLCGQGDYVA